MKSSYDHSDTGNAELLNDLFGEDIRYESDTSRWLQWRDSHRWFELTEAELDRLAIKTANHRFELAKDYLGADAVREVNYAVRSRNRHSIEDTLRMARSLSPIGNMGIQWDHQPHLLSVGNGVVDLSKSRLRPGQRADHISRGIKLPYMPEAKAPVFLQFLSEVLMGNEEWISYMQRAIGYTITGYTREHVFFLLYGDGSNGKSVLINVLGRFLEGFSKTIRFSAFDEGGTTDSRRDLAELPGIRAAFASEGAELRTLDTAMIKLVTGGEDIPTSKKYGHPFTFTPQFKLWLTTNHLPKIDDPSLGFWRRVVLLPFEATFDGSNRDPKMQEKLESELVGILAWAIEGARLWFQDGLDTPNSLLLKVHEYRQDEDDVEQYLSSCCDRTKGATTSFTLLYRSYCDWCESLSNKPMSSKAFGVRLTRKLTKRRDKSGFLYEDIALRNTIRV